MPGMGGKRIVAACGVLWAATAACGTETKAAARENELVLEVGGDSGSLRQALAARGIVIGPPQFVRSPDGVPDGVGTPEPSPSAPAPQPAVPEPAVPQPTVPAPQPAVPQPAEVPPPGPAYRVVELGRHQTLIQLAKQHLGDGNRFREILQLNGWTDSDARRLPTGQKVRIPTGPPPARASR